MKTKTLTDDSKHESSKLIKIAAFFGFAALSNAETHSLMDNATCLTTASFGNNFPCLNAIDSTLMNKPASFNPKISNPDFTFKLT